MRKTEYPIHPLIAERWSPRSMTGESLSDKELFSLFEAARWAPSSFNSQPWRFLYGKRETTDFSRLEELLVPFNKEWCKNAAVLGLTTARINFEKTGKPSPSHALDTGAAWENMCLQGTHLGLVVHGMSGFDYEKARQVLRIPATHEILAMFAIGKRAPKENLSPELQKKEAPSTERKPVSQFATSGIFS